MRKVCRRRGDAMVTLTRTGNTATLAVPKALRESGGYSVGDRFEVTSPRPGVIEFLLVSRPAEGEADRLLDALEFDSREGRLSDEQLVSDVRATLAGRGAR